ncbi:MAG: MOSC domain-containing protein [Chthoniobacterales bacterium]
MNVIGSIESLWRYPVKSMRGEEVETLFAGFAGVYGDRLYAFHSSTASKGFPYLTARVQRQMLRYRPRFRRPEKSVAPPNLAEAESMPPGATPLYGDPADLMLEVETPAGKTVAIDDPALIDLLRAGIEPVPEVTLMRSERALTDCRPLSLFALPTVKKLAEETGMPIDKRCFRANLYLDLTSTEAFAEERLVGRSLRIGSKVVVSIVERDPRCMVITLNPETGEKAPAVLKTVAQKHGGIAGLYGAVMAEGMIQKGDVIELLD